MAGKVTREISERLRAAIASGEHRAGTFLPTEHRLCEKHGVSRGTVRSALKTLAADGLVRICPGKGAYVLGDSKRKGRFERFITGSRNTNLTAEARESVKFLIGICQAAADVHAEAIVSFDEILQPENLIQRYAAGNIDGVLHIECSDYEAIIAPLEKANVPYVVANLESDAPAVATKIDFREVGRMAARHLLALGHRRIGMINGDATSFIYHEMAAGFRGALAEEEVFLSPARTVELKTGRIENGDDSLANLLRRPDRPTGLFCARDARARECFRVCDELGLEIPLDVSVISFDDITWPDAKQTGLTTIREPAEDLGEAAVRLLRQWFTTGERPESEIIVGDLIERGSTAPPRE